MSLKELLVYLDAKLATPREFKRFIEPNRAEYDRLKEEAGQKNYFRNDLGVKGAIGRARMLDLHRTKGLRILDIGTGPAMFPAVCDWYGHESTASDVALNQDGCAWFGACAAIFDVDVKPLIIQSPDGLPEGFEGKWDLVTAFLTNFDCGWEGSGRWDAKDWVRFIDSVLAKSVSPGGRLCLMPVPGSSPPLAAASKSFSGVSRFSRWGVWIFQKPPVEAVG